MCKVLQQQRMGSCITKYCYERVQFEMICKTGNLWFGWEKGNELPGCPIFVTLGMFLRKAQNQKLAHDCICKLKKRKSKETFSLQNFLFRNENINNNVTWKIIALHLNIHTNSLLYPQHGSFSFLLFPFVPSHFALTLYMAVMFVSSTEFSLSRLGIPSVGTEQSHSSFPSVLCPGQPRVQISKLRIMHEGKTPKPFKYILSLYLELIQQLPTWSEAQLFSGR